MTSFQEEPMLREVDVNIVSVRGGFSPSSCELPLPKARWRSKEEIQNARIEARMRESTPLSFGDIHRLISAFLEMDFDTMDAYGRLLRRGVASDLSSRFQATLQCADADAQAIIGPLKDTWCTLEPPVKKSSCIMDVLHVKRNVLRQGLEYPFQDLLDWLLLASLLDEQVTREEITVFSRELGPCNRASVEATLSAGDFSGDMMSPAPLYLALKAVRPVLNDASCITGHYFSTALDRLIEEDEKTVGTTLFQNSDINHAMRTKLCEWLYETYAGATVHRPLREETYFLGTALLDRFLAVRSITRSSFLLCGCAAVLLASKSEEIYSPSLQRVVHDAQMTFTESSLAEMERQIAIGLKFCLSFPTISNIANSLVVEQDPPASPIQRSVLSYLLVALSIYTYHGQYSQSLLAAAAFHISRKVCGVPSNCPSAQVQSVVPVVWSSVNSLSETGSRIYMMFSQRRFHEASLLVKNYTIVCSSHMGVAL